MDDECKGSAVPRVSVIIPSYDVEPYLEACLASVAAQTWRDLEVIVVDDGSPDRGAHIAADFAERDPRFRLIRQANAGLGAARNTGVRHATGEFLAFVDGDDLLPPHAIEYLLAALRRSGSAFATGNVLRYDGAKTRPSALHRPVFARPGLAAHVTRDTALLRDRLVTNKLWRRSFWEEHGLAFPEGVLYEDIPVSLRAHVLAPAVDVLPAPVYVWRERSRSITQGKASVRHLADRFAAVRSVREFLAGRHRGAYVPAWDRVVLETDLSNFLDVLDQGPEEFRTRFLELAGEYLDDVARPVLDGLPALRRVQWHLVRQGDLAGLVEVAAWHRAVRPEERVRRRVLRYHLDVPPAARLPAAVTRADAELDPRHRIDAVRWEDGRLVIEGRAAPECLRPTRRFHQWISAALVHERTGRRIRIPATVRPAPVAKTSDRPRIDWGGFRLVVDPGRLAAPGRLGLWHVELRVRHRGGVRRGRLFDPRATWADRAGRWRVGEDRYVTPVLAEPGHLAIYAGREAARVVTQTVRDGRLRLVGHALGELGPELTVTRRPGGVPVRRPLTVDGRTFHAEVDLRALGPVGPPDHPEAAALAGRAEWRFEVRTAGGGTVPVTAAEDLTPARYAIGDRELVAAAAPSGLLTLREQPVTAFVDLAEWLPGGELLLEGGFAAPYRAMALVVRSLGGPDVHLAAIEGAGTRFRARLTPGQMGAGSGPLPGGRYGLAVRVHGGGDLPIELNARAPLAHRTDGRAFKLLADRSGHAVLAVRERRRPRVEEPGRHGRVIGAVGG